MKWAVSNMHYFYYPWDYFLESQKLLGTEKIDFYGCMPHIWIDHYTYSGCNRIRDSIARQKMKLVLFTPKPYSYCIYAPDKDHGDISEKYYQNCIRAAQDLGVEKISLSLTGGYRDFPIDTMQDVARKRLLQLGALASEQGIQLLLETSVKSESLILSSLAEMESLVASLSCDSFAILINMQALEKNGEELWQWMAAFGHKVQYIRFHNDIDLQVLRAANYQGDGGVCVSDDVYWDAPQEKDRLLANAYKERW